MPDPRPTEGHINPKLSLAGKLWVSAIGVGVYILIVALIDGKPPWAWMFEPQDPSPGVYRLPYADLPAVRECPSGTLLYIRPEDGRVMRLFNSGRVDVVFAEGLTPQEVC